MPLPTAVSARRAAFLIYLLIFTIFQLQLSSPTRLLPLLLLLLLLLPRSTKFAVQCFHCGSFSYPTAVWSHPHDLRTSPLPQCISPTYFSLFIFANIKQFSLQHRYLLISYLFPWGEDIINFIKKCEKREEKARKKIRIYVKFVRIACI